MKTVEELIDYSTRYECVGHADWTPQLETELLLIEDCDCVNVHDRLATYTNDAEGWEIHLHGQRDN